ncbi:MAG: universal stress protein [Deltaproteobacteria bacterium]|nr:universal stress protein [Deltaproteobacteria bacterium]
MYKKILVPLDSSELAECALSHVKNLVKDGAVGEVILLNVFHVHVYRGGEMAGYMDIKGIRENMSEESRKYLADVESRLAYEGIKVKTVSLEGNRPSDTISDYAQNNGVDLIVIASHGYTGLKKLMLGSVALGVLHDSRIPVLLIRPESCRK